MAAASDQLPDEVDTLKAALIEARAKLSGAQALIEHLQLVITKLKREMFGPHSERSQRLIDQLELQDEAKAASVQVQSFTRRQATRRNFPPICHAGALFTPRRARVRAAAAPSSRRSGRMSPRRSMSSRGNGS